MKAADLRQAWSALAVRERRLVLLAGGIVLLAVLWMLVLSPALRTVRTVPAQTEQLERQLQAMQAMAAQARDLKGRPVVRREDALRVLQSRLLVLEKEKEAATKKELAGVITASWGDQMRSYVLAPYQMVKDLRTEYEEGNPSKVFDGELDGFIAAGIKWRKRTLPAD